jgi:hypothetical protein
MMKTMKRCLCLLPLAGALACAADLASVHSVYLLPMARGMDQYLANQLTNEHVFRVVTDPKLADAVFTDHISEAFQAELEDFSPAPKPPAPAKPANAESEAKPGDEAPAKPASTEAEAKPGDEAPAKPSRSDTKAKPGDEPPPSGLMADTENKLSNPAASSGFSRARGTVFLVDAKSRQVIWSIYAPPKDFDGKEMNRTASDIVSHLKRDLNPKK